MGSTYQQKKETQLSLFSLEYAVQEENFKPLL